MGKAVFILDHPDYQRYAAVLPKTDRRTRLEKRLQRLIGDVDELATDDLMRLLSGALLMVLEGKLEPAHLSALQGAAKTMDAIRRTSELERRFTELEAALGNSYGRRVG